MIPGVILQFLLSSPAMTTRLVLALGLVSVLSTQAPAPVQNIPPIQTGDIIITGGQLFDSISDTLRPNTGIIVRRGIFLEVGANLTGRDTSAAQVIRLDTDQTILPGLFDLHAHYAV